MTMNGESGFTRGLGMASWMLAAMSAILALPHAYELTTPYLHRALVSFYGLGHSQWWVFGWKALLLLLIFGVVRAVLYGVFALMGLLLALIFIRREGRN